ncbi:unnamed protein product [Camellia sinensis]
MVQQLYSHCILYIIYIKYYTLSLSSLLSLFLLSSGDGDECDSSPQRRRRDLLSPATTASAISSPQRRRRVRSPPRQYAHPASSPTPVSFHLLHTTADLTSHISYLKRSDPPLSSPSSQISPISMICNRSSIFFYFFFIFFLVMMLLLLP